MELKDKYYKEAKDVLFNSLGREPSDKEINELIEFCSKIAYIALKRANIHFDRENCLKKKPLGFPLESNGYSCLVCHHHMTIVDSWFSKYGQTCLKCYKALSDNLLPSFVIKFRESYYCSSELDFNFKIDLRKMKGLIKDSKLVARVILNEDSTPYEYFFLKKENPILVKPCSPIERSIKRKRDKENADFIRSVSKK